MEHGSGAIKAIETRYKGYRFRSRLEARWAVFFDALNLPWEYEKEGFDLGDGIYYLPDFWLPSLGVWVEVKGTHPSTEERKNCELLATTQERKVYLFYGSIPTPIDTVVLKQPPRLSVLQTEEWEESAEVFFPDGWDYRYRWCECPHCGLIGIQFDGRCERLPCREVTCEGEFKQYNSASPTLLSAYSAARAARFEHGETP